MILDSSARFEAALLAIRRGYPSPFWCSSPCLILLYCAYVIYCTYFHDGR